MPRVTEAEVQAIIDYDPAITDITPFITAANLLITQKFSGSGVSAELLKEMERWLAAHYIAIRDPRLRNEKIGDAAVTYQGQEGMYLDATLYGQQVKTLDPTGTMANLGKRGMIIQAVPQVEWE
jgi:hypothetical protein